MDTTLAQVGALVALLSHTGGIGSDAPRQDLELASIAVTDGIVGGLVGPTPHVLLAAGYDRVEREYRAVRRRTGPEGDEAWVAKLDPEQFRGLLELAVSSGLPQLPLENPPGCADVYGRRRQIRLDYGNVRWANGAQSGCEIMRSTVVPSEDECRQFDDVVARLEQAVDAFTLRRSTVIELQRVQFFPNVRVLDTYRQVMRYVLTDPLRHSLDLERVTPRENRVGFCWRGLESCEPGEVVNYVVNPSGNVVRAPPPAQRRPLDPFVPIETGMTLAAVLERLGEPDEREEREDGSVVVTYMASGQDSPGARQILHPARLRFEDGRLSAP